MGVDEAQVEHVRGTFHGPESSLTLKEVAFAAWTAHNLPEGMEPGLEATYVYDPPNFSWPSGAHVAIVEVDTETGAVELLRYIAVDDVGTVVNPMIVEGQIHGGLAQGVAQALYEEAVYDDDGNLLTGNMVTYLVPSAAEFPRWELHRTETPSPTNPLGVKGVGETGAIASPAAVMNAVVDALAEDGVTDIAMPATPPPRSTTASSSATPSRPTPRPASSLAAQASATSDKTTIERTALIANHVTVTGAAGSVDGGAIENDSLFGSTPSLNNHQQRHHRQLSQCERRPDEPGRRVVHHVPGHPDANRDRR